MSALLFGAAALPHVQPATASATARGRCAVRCTALAARRAGCYAGAQQLPLAHTAGSKGHCRARGRKAAPPSAALKALLWDCDGVILESEDLHRRAYNAVFAHFDVRVDGKARAAPFSAPLVFCTDAPAPDQVVVWSTEYYDKLSNTVGGGKPKMRWCVCAETSQVPRWVSMHCHWACGRACAFA
jgi:hypothetical protein